MDSQKISTGSSESDCTTVPALSVPALGARVTLPCGCVSEFRKYGWHCVQSCECCSDLAAASERRLFA